MSKDDPGYFTFSTVQINSLMEKLKETLTIGRSYEATIVKFRKEGFRTLNPGGAGYTVLECKICEACGKDQRSVKHKDGCPMADITEQHS